MANGVWSAWCNRTGSMADPCTQQTCAHQKLWNLRFHLLMSTSEEDDAQHDEHVQEPPEELDGSTLLGAAPPQFVKSFKTINFVRATSSDAWFLSNSHRRNFASRKLGRDLLRGSSGKRISERLEPLDLAPLTHIARVALQDGGPDPPARTAHSILATRLHLDSSRIQAVHTQLLCGFNVILYGVGDKEPVVQRIVQSGSSAYRGAGVVVQGAAGRALNADRILDAIEAAVKLHVSVVPAAVFPPDPPLLRLSRIAQRIRRVRRLLEHAAAHNLATHPQRLFVGLLAFDASVYHTTRLHTLVHALAQCTRVHLVAAVSHVNAGLVLDGAAGAFGHGVSGHAQEPPPPPLCDADALGIRSLAAPWLWHNCTTYIPPIAEMLHSRGVAMTSAGSQNAAGLASLRLPPSLDLASSRSRPGVPRTAAAAAMQRISQNAAVQVLTTLTARARNLFYELAQLQLREAEKDERATPRIAYATLVRNAQRQFIASSDQGVRQLLGEMVDHGLVAVLRGAAAVTSSHAIAVGDELTIPLPHDRLREVLARIFPESTSN